MALHKQLFLYRKKKENNEASKKPVTPFEQREKVMDLYYMLTIVPEGQEGYVKDLLFEAEVPASASFLSRAQGTAKSDVYEVLGLEDDKKRMVTSIVRKDTYLAVAPKLEAKFKTSRYSAGISVIFRLTSLYGLSAYKFFSSYPKALGQIDSQLEDKYMNDTYEAIFAVVNDGYSDLVMEAARAAGARGGTIFHARGTGHKETEEFYNVVVTPEKEVVMIIVDKASKDKILEAIGREVGLQTKGQGICFSMNCSGTIGLNAAAEHKEDNAGE